MRRLTNALEELEAQEKALQEFSINNPGDVQNWKKAVEDYEADPAQHKNPFTHVKTGTLLQHPFPLFDTSLFRVNFARRAVGASKGGG